MANTNTDTELVLSNDEQLRLSSFVIDGLFDGEQIRIDFPRPVEGRTEAGILILQGRNGSGKTTVLSMIAGMIKLNFDAFRKVPFTKAVLVLSNDQLLTVEWQSNSANPLSVSFDKYSAELAKDRINPAYTNEQEERIGKFREAALPVLGNINFELLGVDRSPSLQLQEISDENIRRYVERELRRQETLSNKVKKFIREAQINHRHYFKSEGLGALPIILERLKKDVSAPTQSELYGRVSVIQGKSSTMKRFGLQTQDDELKVMASVLAPENSLTTAQLSLVETYVEIQEAGQRSRDLIANRLIEFEAIMDEFMLGKQVQLDGVNGLRIVAKAGIIKEDALSSGEYHFLYMMVSALLCQRVGSIIAIDEPELSLHVRWQRKLLGALARCAAGASPLFICATHSLAISAEHSDRVQVLSAVD